MYAFTISFLYTIIPFHPSMLKSVMVYFQRIETLPDPGKETLCKNNTCIVL